MDRKKKISIIVTICAAAALMGGCSSGDFWKVSRDEPDRSSAEETTTEDVTAEESSAETTTLPAAEPVLDKYTRYFDLTKQKNIKYTKPVYGDYQYDMLGFGKAKLKDNILYKVDLNDRETVIAEPENDGETIKLFRKIDDIRFVYTITDEGGNVRTYVYDMAENEGFMVDIPGNMPVKPLCASWKNIIMYTEPAVEGGRYIYYRYDLMSRQATIYKSPYITNIWKSPSAGFSPDGKRAADVSGCVENNGIYEYTVTFFSQEKNEYLMDFVIGAGVEYSDFSLEFHENSCIYVYGGIDGEWKDIYVIDICDGDGIIRIDNRQEYYPAVKKLDIAAADQTRILTSPLVYFCKDGCYYYRTWDDPDNGKRSGWFFDDGSGEPVLLELEGKDWYMWMKDGILYGNCYQSVSDDEDYKTYIYRFDKGKAEMIAEMPVHASKFVYTSDYIYYMIYNLDISVPDSLYRMDYNGKNHECVLTLDASITYVSFTVNGSRIYYYASDYKAAPDYQNPFGVYDMETGEHIRLRAGEMGRINGGYMYYFSGGSLLRMNLEDYKIEQVCELVSHYGFLGDSIIYTRDDNASHDKSLYRLDDNGSTKLFDIVDIPGVQPDDWIIQLQCRDDEIILSIKSGKKKRVVSVDTQGNIIREYYESLLMDAPKT